jgi:hypothetical protein
MKKKRVVTCAVGLMLAVAATYTAVCIHIRDRRYSQWVERSVEEIRGLAIETNWMGSVISNLQSVTDMSGIDEGRNFISPDLLLMKNGEWIIYRAATSKQGPAFPELFIGRGSDEQWHYTTYHFCRGMIMLGADGQPRGLKSFRAHYYLAPYTGQAYRELKKTWPPK